MVRHILVPIDGSPQADTAFEHALAEFPDATITVLSVLNPAEIGTSGEASMTGYADDWLEVEEQRAEERFADAQERADEHGVEVRTATETGRPATMIVEYAEEGDVDQIVMGSHGRDGMSRILLGSVAETVVRRSPVPVTVVR